MKDRIDELLEQAYSKPIAPPAGLADKIGQELSASPVRRRTHKRKRWEIAAAMLLLCGAAGGVWMAADQPKDHRRDSSSDSAMVKMTEKPYDRKTQNGTTGEKEWDNLTGRGNEEQQKGNPFTKEGQNEPFREPDEEDEERGKNNFGTGEKTLQIKQNGGLLPTSASPEEFPKASSDPEDKLPQEMPGSGDELPEASPGSKDEEQVTAPAAGKGEDYIQLCSVEGVYYSTANTEQNGICKPDENTSSGGNVSPASTAVPTSASESIPIGQTKSDIELFSQRILSSGAELSALIERADNPQLQGEKNLDTAQILSQLAGYGDDYFQSNILCIHTVPIKKGEELSVGGVILQNGGTKQETLVIQLKKTGQNSEIKNSGYFSCIVAVPKNILHENTGVKFEITGN